MCALPASGGYAPRGFLHQCRASWWAAGSVLAGGILWAMLRLPYSHPQAELEEEQAHSKLRCREQGQGTGANTRGEASD